jgi:archaeal flagellar protein FlaJ
LIYYDKKQIQIVQIASLVIGSILIVLIFLTAGYFPSEPYWIPLSRNLNTGLAMSILLIMLTPAFIDWANNRYIMAVEENLPQFLRAITNEVQSGVPLMFAMETASTHDYGPISQPLQQTMDRINITSDIEGSLLWFGERLVIPQAKRLSLILIEAYSTGGRVTDILESSLEMFTILDNFKRERNSLTSPYLYIVYLGNFVFLIISWVLLTKFLTPLATITSDVNVQSSGLVSNLFSVDYYWGVLFWAAVIESVVGGFIGGKIKYGKLSKGLVYACVLLLVTIFFFNSGLFR